VLLGLDEMPCYDDSGDSGAAEGSDWSIEERKRRIALLVGTFSRAAKASKIEAFLTNQIVLIHVAAVGQYDVGTETHGMREIKVWPFEEFYGRYKLMYHGGLEQLRAPPK